MKNNSFNKAMTFVVALFTLITTVSCINEEYELSEDRIDLNVTVFQEGIALPLGTTDKFTLAQLMDEMDGDLEEMLQIYEGAYLFRMSDEQNDVLDLQLGFGSFDALAFENSFSFPLENIDLSGIGIEGRVIESEPFDLGEVLDEFDIDKINKDLPVISSELPAIKVSVPTPDVKNLELDLSSISDDLVKETEIAKFDNVFDIPDAFLGPSYADVEMDYEALRNAFPTLPLPDLLTAFEFAPYTVEVPVSFSLPKEIKKVNSIVLDKNASFQLVFEIVNPLFTSGSIIPELDIDLHNLLYIDSIESGIADGATLKEEDVDNDGIFEQHVKDRFVMSSANGWKSDHVYNVASLAINPSDWKQVGDALVIDKVIPVTMSGVLKGQDLKTTLRYLKEHGADVMKVRMDVKFNNFRIDDVQMELNPIVKTEVLEIPISIADINLGTDMVKKVEYFDLAPEYPLTLALDAVLPEKLKSLDLNLRNLTVEFPEGMVVNDDASVGTYDAQARTLTYSNISIKEGLNDKVKIERIYLPDLVNNTLSYSGKVKVTAEAVAEGNLSSKELIEGADGDLIVDGGVRFEPKLKDFAVVIDDFDYDVDFEPILIEESISKEIGEIIADKPLLVGLKKDADNRNPRIEISLEYPEHPSLMLRPKKDAGLKIDFPDMIRFNQKDIPASYNFNPSDNTMTFTSEDAIPRNISLEILNVEINAEKAAEGEGYVIKDRMEVTGGVSLQGTTIRLSDVQELQQMENTTVAFSGIIPDIEPAEFGLEAYERAVETEIAIERIEAEIPAEINSIQLQQILLKDTYLSLVVDASSVKEVVGNVDMTLSVDITLPEMFLVASESQDVTFENHVLSINEKMDGDYRIVVDDIRIVGLDLSGVQVKDGKIAIEASEIPVRGAVKLENLTVDLDNLKGKSLGVYINGSLASADEKGEPTESISIDKITGYVGFDMDPITTSVDLSSLAKELTNVGVDLVMDIHTFYLNLNVDTNIDIPVAGNLEVTQYFGNLPGESLSAEITLDPEERVDGTYSIFVSNMDPNSPESEGRYDVYKDCQCIQLDLFSLLYSKNSGAKQVMADSIQVALNAGTDPERLCVIEPSKDYDLDFRYELGVPMEFGDDFFVEYRDTITGLPADAAKIFEYGSVGLSGKFENGLPFNVAVQVNPLDAARKVIPLKEGVGVQNIASCDKNGNPVTTDLRFILSAEGTDLSGMDAVELIFKLNAKGVAGVPMKEDMYVKASLSALVPDGVTLDLKDIVFAEQEEMEEEE